MARLHALSDYDDAPDSEPTHPGAFATPWGLPEHGHVVNRIICPHHHWPWAKVAAVCAAVAVVVSLAMRDLLH